MSLSRRSFISVLSGGIAALLCAPAIVRASSIMPVKTVHVPGAGMFDLTTFDGLHWFCGYEPLVGDCGPITISKRMTEADWAPKPWGRRGDKGVMDAPALDRAIECALNGI